MLRLPSFEATWSDLARGVRVLTRPATRAEITAASAWARQETDKAMAACAGRLDGLEASQERRDAVQMGYTAIALARLCVTAWDGVEGECTPDNLGALMQVPGMVEAYMPIALAAVTALDAEGNGSAPAPNGITAGAPTTASRAETQE